jgi:hypothetical protein
MLKALYGRRWHVELDVRHIKTTLGMETLRCRTPEMVRKELWVDLLAYTLIRLLPSLPRMAVPTVSHARRRWRRVGHQPKTERDQTPSDDWRLFALACSWDSLV